MRTHQGRKQEDVVLRRRRSTPITVHEARAPGVVDTLPLPLVGANVVTADDCYYASQLARIVARLRLLRRKRIARYLSRPT
jgi:hypothetical protein